MSDRQGDPNANSDSDTANAAPGISSVRDYLSYGLSLPERTLRSTAAMIGGALTESSELLVPQAFRDSRSYRTFVQQMLEMVARDVGGVTKVTDALDNATAGDNADIENFVARKTVGSFVDLAGMATFHLSPALVLAVVSDVAYGSTTYLKELSSQLKKEGIIAEDSTIDSASDLLDAISTATGETAAAFDTPPISLDGIRNTIDETRNHFARIKPTDVLPKAEIDQLWSDMRNMAERENVGLFELSSAMTMYTLNHVDTVRKGALTTVSVTGDLIDRHVLDHYRQGLEEISKRGIYSVLAESSQPYIEAVWFNFSTDRPTVTEDVVSGRLANRMWQGMRGWMSVKSDPTLPDAEQNASDG